MSVHRHIPGGAETMTIGPTGTVARVWYTVDAESESAALALLAAETPPVVRGSAFRDAQGGVFDSSLLLQDFSVTQLTLAPTGGTGTWYIVANYRTQWGSLALDAFEGRTTYRWDREAESGPADFDRSVTPKAVMNTLGDPLEPPLQITRTHRVLVATFLRAGTDAGSIESALLQFENTTNAQEFRGALPECALCQTFEVEDSGLYASDGAQKLFRVTGRFGMRRPYNVYGTQVPAYVEARLNRSYQIWNTSSLGGQRNYEHALDAAGNRVTTPVLIDADGVRIYVQNGVPTMTPHVLLFRRHETSAFHAIPELA